MSVKIESEYIIIYINVRTFVLQIICK